MSVPEGAYLDFSRPKEREAIAGHYRVLFAAHTIQPQDALLRLPNGKFYIGPDVQEHLASLDAKCEERLTRWILGMYSALERG